MIAHPDVSPTGARFGFADTPFEGVKRAVGIGLSRFRLIEQITKIEKVLVRRAPFG